MQSKVSCQPGSGVGMALKNLGSCIELGTVDPARMPSTLDALVNGIALL